MRLDCGLASMQKVSGSNILKTPTVSRTLNNFGTYRRGRFRELLKGGNKAPPFICHSPRHDGALTPIAHPATRAMERLNIYLNFYFNMTVTEHSPLLFDQSGLN